MSYVGRIAKVCHEALDAWREELGEEPVGRFEHQSSTHQEAVASGVRLALRGATPEALHALGVTQPNAAHPAKGEAVPFGELAEDQRKKAALFQAVAQTLGCGVERWDVKTGTDADAARVNLTAQETTIDVLAALPAPPPDPPARVPGGAEFQVFTIEATVSAAKEEADSDYHLALVDADGCTMIAEAVCPGCASGSPWLAQISAVRSAVEAAIQLDPGNPEQYVDVNRQAKITGVGFFDRIHGQRGVAPNGIELHPVLAIEFV